MVAMVKEKTIINKEEYLCIKRKRKIQIFPQQHKTIQSSIIIFIP
jgi:hypothetical protein